MSKADEMFEKLGYIKLQPIGLQRCAYTNGKGKEIIFSDLQRVGLYGDYSFLTISELQAINEKVKELGWL